MVSSKWIRFQYALPFVFIAKLLQEISSRCSGELIPTCFLFRFGDSLQALWHITFFELGLHSINSEMKEVLEVLNSIESLALQVSSPFLLSFTFTLFSLGSIGLLLDKFCQVVARKTLVKTR